jgi:Predicted permease
VLDVVITNKSFVGKTIVDLAAFEFARGVFLKKLTRTGEPMPFSPATQVERGDVLTLVGATRDVARAAKELGYADRQTVMTDMIFVGLGIVLGGFMGLLTLTVAGLPLTLTASGGALIMGLIFGWLRAVHPTFGRIPGSAMWIFDTVGLTVFMACVGLPQGPAFFRDSRSRGLAWSSSAL